MEGIKGSEDEPNEENNLKERGTEFTRSSLGRVMVFDHTQAHTSQCVNSLSLNSVKLVYSRVTPCHIQWKVLTGTDLCVCVCVCVPTPLPAADTWQTLSETFDSKAAIPARPWSASWSLYLTLLSLIQAGYRGKRLTIFRVTLNNTIRGSKNCYWSHSQKLSLSCTCSMLNITISTFLLFVILKGLSRCLDTFLLTI